MTFLDGILLASAFWSIAFYAMFLLVLFYTSIETPGWSQGFDDGWEAAYNNMDERALIAIKKLEQLGNQHGKA